MICIAVCGPPQMWEDMVAALTSIGHDRSALIELKALSDEQLMERGAGDHQVSEIVESESVQSNTGSHSVGLFGFIKRWIGRAKL